MLSDRPRSTASHDRYSSASTGSGLPTAQPNWCTRPRGAQFTGQGDRVGHGAAEGLGHGRVGDLAGHRVDARPQRRVGGDGGGHALLGHLHDVGQGGVGEGVGRRVGHGPGHVADGVVEHVVDDVDGVGVGGLPGGGDASALVNGNVDDDGAPLHAPHHVVGDHHRRPSAGHQHRPDDEVGLGHRPLHRAPVGGQGHDPALVDLVDPPQAVEVLVEEDDLGLHALGDPGRVPPHVARAQHHHPGRAHAGGAAQQHPPPALLPLEEVGADLGGHAPRHLAHGGEEGQGPRSGPPTCTVS